jgi:putative FmdB family regulatory protein
MPVYSFVCPVCGEHFDEKLSFQDNARNVSCPRGHDGARRVFSAPTVVFKGSGFYVTDHRKHTFKENNGS